MFYILKKHPLRDWHKELTSAIIELLPPEYSYLKQQLQAGLLKGVMPPGNGGYVSFTYHAEVSDLFFDKNSRDFILEGIRVYNRRSQSFVNLHIHVIYGLISGYRVDSLDFEPDLAQIGLRELKKRSTINPDYEKLKELLNDKELALVNPSSVQQIEVNGKLYFCIEDLEDGDCIGIGADRKIYRLSQDLFEAEIIGTNLSDYQAKGA